MEKTAEEVDKKVGHRCKCKLNEINEKLAWEVRKIRWAKEGRSQSEKNLKTRIDGLITEIRRQSDENFLSKNNPNKKNIKNICVSVNKM